MSEPRLLPTVDDFQTTGVVERIEGPTLLVATTRGVLRARRAVSCLIEVEVADEVLLAGDSRGRVWVLSVLERDGRGTCIDVPGDLEVRAPAGAVRFVATGAVDLISETRIDASAPEVGWSSRVLKVVSDQIAVVGEVLHAELGKARLESTVIESLAERLTTRVKRAYRLVEELDQLRAKRIDVKAEQLMSLHADTAVLTANQLVKMDAEQVHVG
jgi:hypothetical protein